LVLPSEWYENAPISVIEAYASGKPVVGARIGGIAELIDEGETGWLFDSGSAEDLSRMLSQVNSLSSQAVSEAGRAARALVERRHTPAHYLNSMRDLYFSMGVNVDRPLPGI
jgi:glycosyltransferase involved in cell wall biosynthesis